MPLLLHLSIHLGFSLLAGLIIFLIWRKPLLSFSGGILGGFFIDLDHFIDYFLAFGLKFNLDYFSHGYQFLKSGKVYVLFHGWEYVIILIAVVFVLKSKRWKAFLFAIALGAFFHLGTDLVIDEGMSIKNYSVLYRARNDFLIEKIVTPEHFKKDLEKKNDPKIRAIINP